MISARSVHYNEALKTPQFYLFWGAVCGNAIAGVSIISCAKDMMGDIFATALPLIVTNAFGAGFVMALRCDTLCPIVPSCSRRTSSPHSVTPLTSSLHIVTPHRHHTSSPHIVTPHRHHTSSPHIVTHLITAHRHHTSSHHIVTAALRD
jgi:hypothetical protein